MYDLCIKNGLVYQKGVLNKTNIYIRNGEIGLFCRELLESEEVYDADNNLVLPGLIDPHVHFDLDLGFITSKDDFYHGSKIAALGGVTTIIDFLDPVDNSVDLEQSLHKRLEEAKTCMVDFKFHATIKNPKSEIGNIVDKMKEIGLDSIKLFTTYSDSLRRTYDSEIKELLELSDTEDILVLAHIENDELIRINEDMSYKDLLISRPTISETSETLKLANLVRETGTKLYMVHLSSGETLQALKDEYSDILNTMFIVESCPHYFVFNSEVWNKENGYLFTMAPPLRTKKEQELLHTLFDDVYTIGTDHCSFDKEDKKNKMLSKMPLGIGGIEHSFDVMFERFGLDIVPKMTENVAKIHHLYPQKGVLEIGSDADIMIYKLKDGVITTNHAKSNYSVYEGLPKKGTVISTISRGRFVVKDGEFIPGKGTYLGGKYESNN